jgi:ABC-type sulfate transport system substrate-binding protein
LWYIAYLEDKEVTEHTGMECYMAGKIERNEVDWFPIGQALSLKQQHAGDTKEFSSVLQEIEANMVAAREVFMEGKVVLELKVNGRV